MKFLIFSVLVVYGAAETTSVRATIHCGFQKQIGLPRVFLMEEDFSGVPVFNWFDSDDILDETVVDYGEHFTLDGSEIELFSTEPYLRVRHECFNSERDDFVDLSQFVADEMGIIHLGHIVLTHQGYELMSKWHSKV